MPLSTPPPGALSRTPSLPRRRVALVGIVVTYSLLLILIWGFRMARARSQDSPERKVERAWQRRSEPVCRLFNAPLPSSRWPVSSSVRERQSNTARPLVSVDCTGAVVERGRGQGVFVLWDAETGELYTVSNAAMDIYQPLRSSDAPKANRPLHGIQNAAEAVRASKEWLTRLGLQSASDPWVPLGSAKNWARSWIVTWQRRDQTCTVQIAAFSGDLARFQMQQPRPPH
jgi:hypothetical protein